MAADDGKVSKKCSKCGGEMHRQVLHEYHDTAVWRWACDACGEQGKEKETTYEKDWKDYEANRVRREKAKATGVMQFDDYGNPTEPLPPHLRSPDEP